jgi:Na+/H+ antiporter NhaC
MKWTLYGITLADALTSLDELFDFVPYNWLAFSPAIIIAVGLLTTTTLAIRHYHRVRKFKKQRKFPHNFR